MEAKTEARPITPIVLTKHCIDRYRERVGWPRDAHEIYTQLVETISRHQDIHDLVEAGVAGERAIRITTLSGGKIITYKAVVVYEEAKLLRVITVMNFCVPYQKKQGGKRKWQIKTRK